MMDSPGKTHRNITRLTLITLVLLACAVAIYLRFVNLRQYPGWYSDEGNWIDLAENWLLGKWQNYGVIGAPYSQRLPLFMYITSAAMHLFGIDISVSRAVCSVASLISMGLAAWTAWSGSGRREGLLTLWIAAFAPWIVIFSRISLTYNLTAPFFLFSLIAAWYYLNKPSTGWLIVSAASAALAFSSDYLGFLAGVVVAMALLIKRPQAIGWFVLIFGCVVTLVILPVILIDARSFFLDMCNLFFWGGGVQSTISPLISILINFSELLRRESWILLGLCGLFLIKDRLLRNLLLAATGLTFLLVTRAYTPVGVGLHYVLHLFPIFALGLAVFMVRSFDIVMTIISRECLALFSSLSRSINKTGDTGENLLRRYSNGAGAAVASLIVFSPLAWMFLSSYAMVTFGTDYIFTGNDDLRLVQVKPAEEVRSFVASQTGPDDLVLGSPALIWGLPTMQRADFLAALAYNGQKPHNYINVDNSRYTVELTLDNADYVILDPLAEEFAPLVLPGMDAWLQEIHKWPVVFESGDIRVYKR